MNNNNDQHDEGLYNKTLNECFWAGIRGGLIASGATGALLIAAPRFSKYFIHCYNF